MKFRYLIMALDHFYIALWYHLYNLKNVKNTLVGMLLLIKLQAKLNITLLHECFSRLLNCAKVPNCLTYFMYLFALHKKLSFPWRISQYRDQIRRFLQIWSHLLKKSVMENFIFCAVLILFSNLSEHTI